MRSLLLVLWSFTFCFCASGTETVSQDHTIESPSNDEKLINFGAVYISQWAFYIFSQNKQISEYGSFKNWTENPFKPHYDKDSFDYNLFKHALTGHYYYLFYRSREYSEQSSLFWSFLSSFAFEFTIETITEPPSFQDIYQTPVFGACLGVGAEKLSLYFHSIDSPWARAVGYFLNPFSRLPKTSTLFAAPFIEKDRGGFFVHWSF